MLRSSRSSVSRNKGRASRPQQQHVWLCLKRNRSSLIRSKDNKNRKPAKDNRLLKYAFPSILLVFIAYRFSIFYISIFRCLNTRSRRIFAGMHGRNEGMRIDLFYFIFQTRHVFSFGNGKYDFRLMTFIHSPAVNKSPAHT